MPGASRCWLPCPKGERPRQTTAVDGVLTAFHDQATSPGAVWRWWCAQEWAAGGQELVAGALPVTGRGTVGAHPVAVRGSGHGVAVGTDVAAGLGVPPGEVAGGRYGSSEAKRRRMPVWSQIGSPGT